MASYANVFIKTSESPDRIAGSLSQLLGKDFVRNEDGIYRSMVLGVSIEMFGSHGLEADREMDFPEYSVEIDLGPFTGIEFEDEFVSALALNLAWQITSKLEVAVMVTRDLQEIIRRFDGC
jgi:hypothetical protein